MSFLAPLVKFIPDMLAAAGLGFDMFGKKAPKPPTPSPVTTIPGSVLQTVVGGAGSSGGSPLVHGGAGANPVLAQALGTNARALPNLNTGAGADVPPSATGAHPGGHGGSGAAPPSGTGTGEGTGGGPISSMLPWIEHIIPGFPPVAPGTPNG